MKEKISNFIISIGFYIITFLFGNFIPKNKKLVVLGSNQGKQFVGNAKALYEELIKDSTFNVFICLKDKKLVEKLRGEGIMVVYNYSLKALGLFLRAKIIAVTHGFADVIGCFPSIPQVWIYLGHGIGTKALGYLKEDFSIWERIRLKFLKKCYFLSTSDFDRYMWCTMYGLKPKKVPITGYPRNDFLLQEPNKNKSNKITRVLYAPTYREEGIVKLFPFSDFGIEKLNKFIVKNNIEIYIRFHPGHYKESKDIIKKFFNYKNIKDLNPDVLEDVQEFLPKTDILITDFSSISRDFLFLDRPIIFITNDIDRLGKLALPIRKEFTFCGEKVTSLEELESALKSILNAEDKYSEIRRFMRDLSYNSVDNKSSKRVVDFIKKLLNVEEQ